MGLIPLGFWAASGGGAPASPAYELISTTVLGSSAASVTFSGLGTSAAAYKHLQIRYAVRGDRSGGGDNFLMRLNGDSGSNYNTHYLSGNGTSVASSYDAGMTTAMDWTNITSASAVSGAYGVAVIDLLDAFSTTKFKTRRAFAAYLASSSDSQVFLTSNLWRSTAAITSITFLPRYGANIVAGSRFSLYGLRG